MGVPCVGDRPPQSGVFLWVPFRNEKNGALQNRHTHTHHTSIYLCMMCCQSSNLRRVMGAQANTGRVGMLSSKSNLTEEVHCNPSGWFGAQWFGLGTLVLVQGKREPSFTTPIGGILINRSIQGSCVMGSLNFCCGPLYGWFRQGLLQHLVQVRVYPVLPTKRPSLKGTQKETCLPQAFKLILPLAPAGIGGELWPNPSRGAPRRRALRNGPSGWFGTVWNIARAWLKLKKL